MAAASAASGASRLVRLKVLKQMTGGLVVCAIPVAIWWKSAVDERQALAEEVRTKIRIPNVATTDDLLIEKCQPGDVILFDRRCSKCASGPWAALSCLAQKQFLCNTSKVARSVEEGSFEHIGLVVPGYITKNQDELDPSNLLLLEATPHGIVAHPLKARLERTLSRSMILLQLCSPGEKRNTEDDDSEQLPTVVRAKQHVEHELRLFRDTWIELGQVKGYKWIHSTIGLGGALAYGLGMQDYTSGPVSPSAYLVLMGLQKAAAAQNINEKEHKLIKVEDFLRDYRFEEHNAVRLRPGWRFLAPIPLRETSKS